MAFALTPFGGDSAKQKEWELFDRAEPGRHFANKIFLR